MKTIDKQQSPSILLVEDDEDDIFILKEGFDDIDFKNLLFYTDAATAFDYLNSIDDDSLPSLIVTDFNLPAVNGLEFVKFIKSTPRLSNIPVVILTTSMSVINRKLFYDEGVAQVIIKPSGFYEYKTIAGVLKNLVHPPSI
ncbi:response regulator [Segetibacter sp.]|uniref:response regulator n=1 Tax=Segetibacter sp. TaxID=2231182 RepID=UPI002623BD7D|nr:response regulator [Segetibacter sp.]MCW3080772.1 response regulator [Segetibacter sp.]